MLSIIINNVLLAQRRESLILFSACIGSSVNIVLSFILIPTMRMNATTVTTLIADFLLFFISAFQVRETLERLQIYLVLSI